MNRAAPLGVSLCQPLDAAVPRQKRVVQGMRMAAPLVSSAHWLDALRPLEHVGHVGGTGNEEEAAAHGSILRRWVHPPSVGGGPWPSRPGSPTPHAM
jgi:hypothetical protein